MEIKIRYKIVFVTAFLMLSFSCKERDNQTIVGWKTIEEYSEEHHLIVDTLGVFPYNNSTLEFLIEIDSMLKSKEINLLNSPKEFIIGEFEISIISNSSFNLDGREMNFLKVSVYSHNWPWNQIYIYSPEYGIVAEFPGHSRKKNMLVFMITENDTIYKLEEQLLEYFENDTILNPVPPFPTEPLEEIEVFEHLSIEIEAPANIK